MKVWQHPFLLKQREVFPFIQWNQALSTLSNEIIGLRYGTQLRATEQRSLTKTKHILWKHVEVVLTKLLLTLNIYDWLWPFLFYHVPIVLFWNEK